MIFSRKQNQIENIVIRIERHIIERVTQTKFIGVIMDEKLTWRNHVNHISTKIAKGIGILIKARFRLKQKHWYLYIVHLFTHC